MILTDPVRWLRVLESLYYYFKLQTNDFKCIQSLRTKGGLTDDYLLSFLFHKFRKYEPLRYICCSVDKYLSVKSYISCFQSTRQSVGLSCIIAGKSIHVLKCIKCKWISSTVSSVFLCLFIFLYTFSCMKLIIFFSDKIHLINYKNFEQVIFQRWSVILCIV